MSGGVWDIDVGECSMVVYESQMWVSIRWWCMGVRCG